MFEAVTTILITLLQMLQHSCLAVGAIFTALAALLLLYIRWRQAKQIDNLPPQ